MSDEKSIAVKVALRSRPLVEKEILQGCQNSLTFVPNEPQVIVADSKAFTFDYAFPCDCSQEDLYNDAIAGRIDYLFKGYNVTVLAYGQTGSGKTHTMGTSYKLTPSGDHLQWGVIQRAVKDIFDGIQQRDRDTEFLVKVSFLEVYKEDVYDLLQKSKDNSITIREDQDGIKIIGLTEQPVTSASETFHALELGSISRTTASTAMNSGSSRSHAIFTITLEQRAVADSSDMKRAKFHLVDLAGSERANKTGTSGERFKEGVNINRGLLALGNVISSLCDESSHIPYRDSKLTRLLQDSLGGNSHTIMIACVSPADSNMDETLNTLRYADRARKIKNKPIVNTDSQSADLQKLKQQVQQLQLQLLQNAKNASPASKMKNDEDMKVILERNTQLEKDNIRLAKELQNALDQTTALCEKAIQAENNNGKLLQELKDLKDKTNQTVEALMKISENNPELQNQLQLFKGWQNKIVEIQCEQAHKSMEFSIYSPCPKRSATSNGSSSFEDSDGDDFACDVDMTDAGENAHTSTLKQAAMSRQLQELERMLVVKQELAHKMQESDSQMAVMRIHYETNVKQMEEEIITLQKEKEDLTNALKAAHVSTKTSKVSEQRRKRLQELEQKITDMKKQIQEKSRLLKMKQDAERKVNTLQQEIQGMKTARVKLLKQIREESDRYRTLKVEKEREVAQLKQKDRKRQYEIVKLQDEVKKQKNVLKRKMEEATAANKRLNEALKLQKTVAERRLKSNQQTVKGIGSRVQQWLEQEMELVLSSKEVQHHLKILMEDRKTIVEQITFLKNALESSEPPRKRTSRGSTDDETREADEQIESLEKEFKLRNMQILELQREISNADQDEKTKQRWETVQSMVEAKCAMKWLFESVIDAKFSDFLKASESKIEMENSKAEQAKIEAQLKASNDANERLSRQLHCLKDSHQKQTAKLIQKYEDKVIYLMKQLTEANDSNSMHQDADFVEQKEFLKKELEKLGHFNETLGKKNKEIEELKKQLALALPVEKKQLPKLNTTYESDPYATNEKKSHSTLGTYLAYEGLDFSINEDFIEDDVKADPDYKIEVSLRQKHLQNNTEHIQHNTTSGCFCKGGCGSKRCRCKKVGGFCSDMCKCPHEICINRNVSLNAENENDYLNTTFSKKAPSTSSMVLREVNGNTSHDEDVKKSISKFLYKDSGDSINFINESGLKKEAPNRLEKYLEVFRSQKLS